jgi:hypothetical protein
VLALTGCSSTTSTDSKAPLNSPPGASAKQLAALEDNIVTEDEYTAGYRGFIACLADKGYTVMELGRPSTLYEIGIPDPAVQSGADEECYNREWAGIDMVWQTTHPERTILSDWYIDCLEEAGIETEDPSGSNNNELGERMIEAGLDPGACIEAHDPR